MHGVIKDPELKEKIKKVMKDEGITFEQLIKKYFEFPDDADAFIYREYYSEFEKAILRKYKNPKLKDLMEECYFLIMKSAKDEYDASRLLYDIKADNEYGTYKKRKT